MGLKDHMQTLNQALAALVVEHKVERERGTESGLYLVEKVPAVIIVEVNAEPTRLTHENVCDYFIQGKTGAVLPKLVGKVKELRR